MSDNLRQKLIEALRDEDTARAHTRRLITRIILDNGRLVRANNDLLFANEQYRQVIDMIVKEIRGE